MVLLCCKILIWEIGTGKTKWVDHTLIWHGHYGLDRF